jgi:hypothetical protein
MTQEYYEAILKDLDARRERIVGGGWNANLDMRLFWSEAFHEMVEFEKLVMRAMIKTEDWRPAVEQFDTLMNEMLGLMVNIRDDSETMPEKAAIVNTVIEGRTLLDQMDRDCELFDHVSTLFWIALRIKHE